MIPDVDNDSLVYLNGQYKKLSEATVSVLDRGFIFGDGIYEVVPAYQGKPFRMTEHLARLERSLKALEIVNPLTGDQWRQMIQQLLEPFGTRDAMVYLQITRGVARRDHAFPVHAPEPTVFGMASPLSRPSQEQRSSGLSVIAITDERWLHCDIKSVSLLGNVFAKQQAVRAGVDEVVQFRDGFMTEGASCNIWVVRNGTLLAPPRNTLILEGIRYGFMQELAEAAGIAFEARPITRAEVESADELMLTSATKEVLPITRYDNKPVGSGVPGPVYTLLRAGYDTALAAL